MMYNGEDLKSNPRQPNIGYCPQFPALIPSLSGTENQHLPLMHHTSTKSISFKRKLNDLLYLERSFEIVRFSPASYKQKQRDND